MAKSGEKMEKPNYEALWTSFMQATPTPTIAQILDLYRRVEPMRQIIAEYLWRSLNKNLSHEVVTLSEQEIVDILCTVDEKHLRRCTICTADIVRMRREHLIQIALSDASEILARTASDHLALIKHPDCIATLELIALDAKIEEIRMSASIDLIRCFEYAHAPDSDRIPKSERFRADIAIINLSSASKDSDIRARCSELLNDTFYDLPAHSVFTYALTLADDEEAIGAFRYTFWPECPMSYQFALREEIVAEFIVMARSEALGIEILKGLADRKYPVSCLDYIRQNARPSYTKLIEHATSLLIHHPCVSKERLELLTLEGAGSDLGREAEEILATHPETIAEQIRVTLGIPDEQEAPKFEDHPIDIRFDLEISVVKQ
jgi:hypothetical protein